jgi:hypothetical protein
VIDHLLAIKKAVVTAGAAGLTALPLADQDRFLKGCERIVQAGYAQNPAAAAHGPKRRGPVCVRTRTGRRRKQSKARNLLDRFRDHPDSVLASMRGMPSSAFSPATRSCQRSTPRDVRPRP